LPSTAYDIADLWRQLLGFVESFTNPNLKLLLTTMLADPAIAQAYREAPRRQAAPSRLASRLA